MNIFEFSWNLIVFEWDKKRFFWAQSLVGCATRRPWAEPLQRRENLKLLQVSAFQS
jgi:hypothetical protein